MNANVVELIQKAADALARPTMSSVEARDLRDELYAPLAQIEERISAIRPPSARGGQGSLRAEVAATGSDEDLAKLDREHERLAAQFERLTMQREQLNQRRHEALAREASEALPSMLASLGEAVDALEAAHRAIVDREQAVRQVFAMINTARSLCRNAGLPAAAGDESMAQRLVQLMPDYRRHADDTIETVVGTMRRDHLAAA